MPFTMAAFFIAALSIIGLPPLVGIWSKVAIVKGAVEAGHLWFITVLMLSSLLNIAYLVPIPLRAFFKGGPVKTNARQEAPLTCLIAIGITTTICIILFFTPNSIQTLLAQIS